MRKLLKRRREYHVVALLFRQLGQSWVSMSLFLVGRSLDIAAPIIVVFVQPFTLCDWQLLATGKQHRLSNATSLIFRKRDQLRPRFLTSLKRTLTAPVKIRLNSIFFKQDVSCYFRNRGIDGLNGFIARRDIREKSLEDDEKIHGLGGRSNNIFSVPIMTIGSNVRRSLSGVFSFFPQLRFK